MLKMSFVVLRNIIYRVSYRVTIGFKLQLYGEEDEKTASPKCSLAAGLLYHAT